MPFIILTAILISLPASLQADTHIYLKKGLNSIDSNGDGIPDAVFSATYDNKTSHPSKTLNIFVSQEKAGLSYRSRMTMALPGPI